MEAARRRVESVDPARFEPLLRMIGMDDFGGPIHVLIAPEDSELARSTPGWISGFADGLRSVIVLFPARAQTYPDDGLEQLLRHEVAHILIWRAAGERPVPRWFNEGLAVTAGRSWSLEDRRLLIVSAVTGKPVSLEAIERAFGQGEVPASRAYALSSAFVRYLLGRHGNTFPAAVLSQMASGVSFEEAFANVTGESLAEAEHQFWQRQTLWNRWVPFITSSFVIWIGITLLALWAFRRRRARDLAVRRRWEEEELARERVGDEDHRWIH